MKLEKFDYKIGNKNTKKQFIAVGVLCIALIVTVVLYKTFASFSSSSSYNIISGRVASFGETRKEIIRIDIGKTEQDEVYAILYDDNTLSIDGNGYMKDFTQVDLIGELLDTYIDEKVDFSEGEIAFINENKSFMYSLFDYAGRSFMTRDNHALAQVIQNKFEDNEGNPIESDINTANSLMTKVSSANFDIDQIEIVNDVKNIGKNAFSLENAIINGNIRDNIYEDVSSTKDFKCNSNTESIFEMVTVEADLESVGDNATLDLNARNITIGDDVTVIPSDLFAWYNGRNQIVCNSIPYSQKQSNNDVTITIPSGITSIGVNAFYSYNGSSLVLPNGLEEIEEYAFANYYGNDITIPSSVTTIKVGAFRDFEGKINMNNCPTSNNFAPKADIYANGDLCEFN